MGDEPAVKVTKTKIRAAEENPELLGVLLTSKRASLWVDTRSIDPELDAALAAWLSDPAARKIVMDLKIQRKLLRSYGYELAGAVEDPALSSYMCGFIPTATRKLFSERMEDLAERYLWIPQGTLRAAGLPARDARRTLPVQPARRNRTGREPALLHAD